jgi:hypothetical protein
MWSSWWNKNWQGKPKHSEKTCPSALCPSQISQYLIWGRTRAAEVGSRRLTAWAVARPQTAELKILASLHDYTSHFLIISQLFITFTAIPNYRKASTRPLSIFERLNLFLKLLRQIPVKYIKLGYTRFFHVLSNWVFTSYSLIWRYWKCC